jgi:hypothetical protein
LAETEEAKELKSREQRRNTRYQETEHAAKHQVNGVGQPN